MASEPIYCPDDPHRRNNNWAVAHVAFHDKLIDACGSPVLLDICRRLSGAAELYRAWSGAWADGRQPVKRDIATEHRELMEAALAHDAGRAVLLFEAHVDRTAAILLDLDAGAAAPSAARAAGSASPPPARPATVPAEPARRRPSRCPVLPRAAASRGPVAPRRPPRNARRPPGIRRPGHTDRNC